MTPTQSAAHLEFGLEEVLAVAHTLLLRQGSCVARACFVDLLTVGVYRVQGAFDACCMLVQCIGDVCDNFEPQCCAGHFVTPDRGDELI